jgi:putative ABC transport system permease protein
MAWDRWRYTVPLRLRSLFRGGQADGELDEELQYYLDRKTAEGVAAGMTPVVARQAALRAMGGVEQHKEVCRDARRVRFLHDFLRDLRFGARMLRRSPGFTTVAVLSLALGIGANTAIFHLLDALRLRPLPVRDAHDLAIVQIPGRTGASGSFDGRYPDLSYSQWMRIRSTQQAFSGMFAWGQTTFDLSTGGESRFAENGLWVSGGFFDVLGIRPILGRLLAEPDDVRGCGAPGVVLSHAFWKREFGADPSLIGKRLTVNGHSLEVIGVTPASFFGVEVGRSFDLALPLCAQALIAGERSTIDVPWAWWLAVMGRLKPGWSLEQSTAHLQSLSPTLFRETLPSGYSPGSKASYLSFTLGSVPGASGFSSLREQYDTPLWLLLAIAGIVLLIACANLANLMLARTSARQREVAVRLALGASRGRVARQLFVESALLAGVGAVCGAWLAPALSRTVVAMMSSEVSPMFVDLGTDWRVLTFTASLTILTCLLFGLAPAVRGASGAPGEAMKAGGRASTAAPRRAGLRRALVVSQVALSLVLLVSGLLFVRSLFNLLKVDTGFQQEGILEADIDLTRLRLPVERRHAFRRDILDRVRAAAGVDAAATAMTIPLAGNWSQTVYLPRAKGLANFNGVSAGYFETLRTPLVAGRDFDARDTPGSPRVAIVNEAFVRRFLDGTDPLSSTFRVDGPRGEPEPIIQIVGVVWNTKYRDLREAFQPIVYLAGAQHTAPGEYDQILIRAKASSADVLSAVKLAIESTHPQIAFHFHDFREQIRYSLLRERLMATLCGFFALVAALLATVGVYGVTAYSAGQRTAEIGVRLALGAGPRDILVLILREAAALLAAGVVVGTVLALVAGKAAGVLLFGLQPNDAGTLALAAVMLAAAVGAASYLPARRASRSDPLIALRGD